MESLPSQIVFSRKGFAAELELVEYSLIDSRFFNRTLAWHISSTCWRGGDQRPPSGEDKCRNYKENMWIN